MLQFLERYSDLITNFLDLVSFLLVTPELLRRVRPIVGPVLLTTSGIAMIIPWAVGLFILAAKLGPPTSQSIGSALKSIGLVLVWTILSFVLPLGVFSHFDRRIDRWKGPTTRNLFASGAVLFFVSRLIAFIAAVAKLSAEAPPPAH